MPSSAGWLAFKIAWVGPDRVDALYPCWAFLGLRGGSLDVQVQGGWSSWEPDRAVVLPPFEVATLRHRGAVAVVSVLLAPSDLVSAAVVSRAADPVPMGAFMHGNGALIHETARATDACWSFHDGSAGVREDVERPFGRAVAAAIVDARASVPRWQASPIVRRTKEAIDRHYTRSLRLEGLAREVGVSKYHLLRQFRRQVGIAPHAYQVAVRVARSRELLARGLPAVDVAGRVGFYDQSAYTRAFKRAAGITPGAYAGLVQQQTARGVWRVSDQRPVRPYGASA